MSNKLDELQIPKPCPTAWEEMTGNDRMRYCVECKKHVYNLSKMSRREAEALIATRGELCARIVRNPDGTLLTEERITISHTGIRRASPVASAVVTAILTISSSAVAQSPALTGKPIPAITKEAGEKRPDLTPQAGSGTASIAGTVTDKNGAVIVTAIVRLINEQTRAERTIGTGEDGLYNFSQVDAGSYVLKVEANGFATKEFQTINVNQEEELSVDVTMSVAFATTVTMGGAIALPVNPLRELYHKSERIVVARVGRSFTVETDGESSLMKTKLRVTSTLKGSGRERTVDVYHWVYGGDETFTGGASLLVFLKRRQDEHGAVRAGYEVIDARRGVKKLSEADLQVYLRRIDDLAAIMSKEKPERAEIVEWLVRCAEEPATRWEGVYELARSADSLSEDSEETTKDGESAVEEKEAPVEEAENEAVEEADEAGQASEPPLAALLTAAQKERLNRTLFNIKTITEDDRNLIELVQHWDDGRLVPFLLAQLKQMEENPSRFADEIVNLISDALGDEDVNIFAAQYGDNISYEDLDAEVEASEAEEADTVEEAEMAEETEDENSPAEARQNRSEMLKKFIALVEDRIAKRSRASA